MLIYQKQIYSPFQFMHILKNSSDPLECITGYDQWGSCKYTDQNGEVYDCILFMENKVIIRLLLKNNKIEKIDYAATPVGFVKKIQWKIYTYNNEIRTLYRI